MTEKEALEQSLEHWRDNLAKVKALKVSEIGARENRIFVNVHAIAYGLFGIAIDNNNCAMCQFRKNSCHNCILWDEMDKNGITCCAEWRRVCKSLCDIQYNISVRSVTKVIATINSMVHRLEHELEVYDDKNS